MNWSNCSSIGYGIDYDVNTQSTKVNIQNLEARDSTVRDSFALINI
jgi:hypothetical protein